MKGLVVENLYKSYCVHGKKIEVHNDLCFSAESGSFVWIYGNSGAGKSTFLNVITGIDTPDSGSVFWDGTEISCLSVNERAQLRLARFGLVFQFFELIKAQTVYDNAALPLKIARTSKKEIARVLFPLFEYFDLQTLLYKKPDQLSGGEKQRVALVRALSTSPQYLIADEITSSLDTERSCAVYAYLRRYIKERNAIGIFVSHDPIIKEYADKSYGMKSAQA